MNRQIYRHTIFTLVILIAGMTQNVLAAPAGEQVLVELMRKGGVVLMIRHALAPGIGDPEDFKVDDCSTQRNLNDVGRDQARSIGEWLRSRGITRARVYSSQWCRCLDTARLLDIGPVTELPALNSFFERPQDREPNLAALRDFISQNKDEQLIIMVTHQVTISGITDEWTDSGHGKLVKQGNNGQVELLGQLSFEEN